MMIALNFEERDYSSKIEEPGFAGRDV